ncbi:MAG: hypothetical protein DVB22_002897, partial [Verrucomicrobia bacterium]
MEAVKAMLELSGVAELAGVADGGGDNRTGLFVMLSNKYQGNTSRKNRRPAGLTTLRRFTCPSSTTPVEICHGPL